MKKRLIPYVALFVVALLLVPARAQMQSGTSLPNLPKVLWLYQEAVKPAKDSTHDRVEHGFAQVWAKAKVAPYIGMNSLTSSEQTIFMSGYDSLASFETDFQTFNKAMTGPMQTELQSLERQESDLVSGVHSAVAVLRDDLSYMTDQWKTDLPKSRYLEIVTIRVGPGKDVDFTNVAKFYKDAFKKGEYAQPFAIYRVLFGAPNTTFLVMMPMPSLKALDTMLVTEPKLLAAMGEDNMQLMMKTSANMLVSSESNIYAFNPKISDVSADFASVDPGFWTPESAGTTMAKSVKSSGYAHPREKK